MSSENNLVARPGDTLIQPSCPNRAGNYPEHALEIPLRLYFESFRPRVQIDAGSLNNAFSLDNSYQLNLNKNIIASSSDTNSVINPGSLHA